MATKLLRKQLPSGFSAAEFVYQGRPGSRQGDYGPDVGLVDMACIDQFGQANKAKYYHAGVVSARGKWFVYLEWGRMVGRKSWVGGSFGGQDFQFVACSSESEARDYFAKQSHSKNMARIETREIGGVTVNVSRPGKDGYMIQSLAMRERGLPDAYTIKDLTGVPAAPETTTETTTETKKVKKVKAKKGPTHQPEVLNLARDLIGGLAQWARSATQATGITPTLATIQQVRDKLIPEAMNLIQKIGNDESDQIRNKDLQDISTYVASLVPRPIPRSGDARSVLLSATNIFVLQQDLDAFESALKTEAKSGPVQKQDEIDPAVVLNSNLEWLSPTSERGAWVREVFTQMTNNRHGHIRKLTIHNVFAVQRPRLETAFVAQVQALAKKRGAEQWTKARLQPARRDDVQDIADVYDAANVALTIHGTRSVNVAPILQSDFRLPRALKGVHITGSAFGAGWYAATDWKKSAGYCSSPRAIYSGSDGSIGGRHAFMFVCDAALGKPYMTRSTMWGEGSCPSGYDSVAAYPEHVSVQNDEHVLFDTQRQRVRYLVELDF